MNTPVSNFADVAVSTGYDSGATSIVVETGGGSRFPSTFPYPVTWWNATDYPNPARDPNREIVHVTNRSSDTLTIVRGQEGTSATAKNIAGKTYRICLGITKAMWEELAIKGSHVSGLSLGTHPDADLALQMVVLHDVDCIVMDDGTVMGNENGEWSGLTADITISGAGGLDTGAEASGNLYDIYAIAKADGTRNLLLHRCAVSAINTLQATAPDLQPIRESSGNEAVGQGFQLQNSGIVPHVDIYLQKTGAPTGLLIVEIQSSSSGLPSNTPVSLAYVMDVSRLQTSLRLIRVPMKVTNNLSAATQYHIVVMGTWAINGSDYVSWGMAESSNPYANGTKALYDGASWTAVSGDDMSFFCYVNRHDSPVTMPSGYTKKRHLGYVSNAGGGGTSDFIPFTQIDRSTRFLSAMARVIQNETIPGPHLYDLGNTALLPWREGVIRAHVALTGTGSAPATYALGDWRSTDISASTGVGAQLILHAPLTDELPCAYGSLDVTHSCIIGQGTAGADLYLTGFDW